MCPRLRLEGLGYLTGDYFKAKVSTTWVHGRLAKGFLFELGVQSVLGILGFKRASELDPEVP